jgi:VIT1/CCC1 family predicted Fe2+/Mn2+ transporter
VTAATGPMSCAAARAVASFGTLLTMTDTHDHQHMVHTHRDVQGGEARAAVFGVSDGLVSNVALIIGIAGASTDGSLVRLAGVSGLLAGAVSMAAGEWVSVRAQNELVERELEIERRSLAENPIAETNELAAIYRERGLKPQTADELASEIMADPEMALDVHAREELGIDPAGAGSPFVVATTSFWAFAGGAFVPLAPWLVAEGTAAVLASVVLGVIAAALVGVAIAIFTERSKIRTACRQVIVAAGACGATYLIGSLLGVSVS